MVFINHFIAASNLSHQCMCLQQLGGKKCRQTTNKTKNLNRKPEFSISRNHQMIFLCVLYSRKCSLQ